jgi:c-di-GMP phosphodiesterase
MVQLFVVRQPVFDSNSTVVLYDLLYTSYEAGNPFFTDEEKLTAHQILDTFVDIGIDLLFENKRACFTLTHSFIQKKYPIQLPPDRVLLRFYTNIVENEESLYLRNLAQNGYKMVLECTGDTKEIMPFLDFVSYIRIDIEEFGFERLKKMLFAIRKPNLTLWAHNIRTKDIFNHCRSAGFELFQGDFITQPEIVHGRGLTESTYSIVALLNKLQSFKTDFSELEEIISRDVSLSYKFMRLLNSPLYAPSGNIKSIRQGLVYMGLKGIRNWASLMFIVRVYSKPQELTIRAMFRAKMCELLAVELEKVDRDAAFTVGLFSLIDSLLDVPMEQILSSLPFNEEIVSALMRKEGIFGKILECTLACERADWKGTLALGLKPEVIKKCYMGSIDWVKSVKDLLLQAEKT